MKAVKKGFLSSTLLFFPACLLVGMAFLIPLTAMAGEVEEMKGLSSIPQYVSYILNTIMLSAGALSVLVIIFGGLYWLVSLGRSKITSEGKEWVKAGILGLILITFSYLIITTINPKILSFAKLSFLPIPVPIINIVNQTITESVPTISFDEVPIGTITESLISRRMDCFDFDANGEPIDGDPSTADIWEPTLINHDRIDCILKLAEAVDTKSKIFALLSKKITEIMNTCTCGSGYVKSVASCSTAACDSACAAATPRDDGLACTPEAIKTMEHGPIILDNGESGGSSQTFRYAGLDEFRSQFNDDSKIIDTVEKEITDKKTKVIIRDIWEKLRLIDKLKYLKEKIKQINLDKDLTNLKNAKSKLNNNCYFSSSAVKFLVDSASTSKSNLKITTNNNFIDQITEKPVDNSKYCEGFAYGNSNAFYYCQNTCNPISQKGQECFKGCTTKACLSGCIDNQGCTSNPDLYNNFQSCLTYYRNECSQSCTKKYSNSSKALQDCQKQCQTDSKSLVDNKDRTYLATDDLKICADIFSDSAQFKRCAEFALQGEYCSNQNPGDPDVFKDPWPATTMPNKGDYSSLYFYKHPEQQKCPQCSQKTNLATGKVTITGVQQYQECWKGPSCSYIPKAPCKDDTCKPTEIIPDLLNCSSTCEKFSYSGEPLTFYCANGESGANWVKEKWQLYNDMICQKITEIPVGQTVDGAIAWAEKINDLFKKFLEKTEGMIQYINTIGTEKNYCKRNSPCGDRKTACQPSCKLYQSPVFNREGSIVGVNCNCSINYEGSPCQKMIGLLLGKKADDKCPKGTEYKGIANYANKISEALAALKNSPQNQDRSEVLKRLNYSREKMDENSIKIKITPDKTLSMFNCYQAQLSFYPTIVNDDVVIGNKKISGYCYGYLGSAYLKIPNFLLDNWFSCEKQIQEK